MLVNKILSILLHLILASLCVFFTVKVDTFCLLLQLFNFLFQDMLRFLRRETGTRVGFGRVMNDDLPFIAVCPVPSLK